MREPELGRILGDIEENDPSAVMTDDDQAVEQPERRGRNDEHVDGHGVAHVIAQEAAPGRGGDPGPPGYVSADSGLADLDAELEQLAVDGGERLKAGLPGSSGGSNHGSRGSFWAVPGGVIAIANRVESLCDATESRLSA
jgi:hypothetical protein